MTPAEKNARRRAMTRSSRELRARAADLLTMTAWTQGAYARDHHGASCLSTDERAVSLSIMGALLRQILSFEDTVMFWRALEVAERQLMRKLRTGSLEGWNDAPGRTKEEVIAALRPRKRR